MEYRGKEEFITYSIARRRMMSTRSTPSQGGEEKEEYNAYSIVR